jgi:prepilin signal peptidase PulO-like enzyme (type II secretory pathway)
MIILVLAVLGLSLGSFVNALVWRLHEQAELAGKGGKKQADYKKKLSISRGRSMCPHCHHELAGKDLVPVLSWLALGGKCRYCGKPVSWQYPTVEIANAILFIVSYLWWPYVLQGSGLYYFVFWLVFLVGFMALTVYDLRWQLLPNKLVFPLIGLAIVQVLGAFIFYDTGWQALAGALWGVLISSGIFYAIFQVSNGAWIGGGDVKLGVVIGLLLGGPLMSLLMLFVASCLGTLVGLPFLLAGKRQMRIPFGPFLIAGTVLVILFGASIINWYKTQFLS